MRDVSTVNRLIIKVVAFLLLLLVVSAASFAQKKVTGKVTSNATDGQPVTGATVTAKKSKISTVTQADGAFSFTIPSDETTLTISSIGFQSEDVPINAEGNVLVT